MPDCQLLKQRVRHLRNNRDYSLEALPIYGQLWNECRDACDEWDGWVYAHTLRRNRRYEEALEVCRCVFRLNRDFPQNRNTYAWCVYYTQIKVDKIDDENNYLKAANAICDLSSQEDRFSPYVRTIFEVAQHFKSKGNINSEHVLHWLGRLNTETLSRENWGAQDDRGEDRTWPSDLEKYYNLKTKALLDKGEYGECKCLCELALSSEIKLINKIWFKYKLAKCEREVGSNERAINLFSEVLRDEKEWYVQKEIAETHLKAGDIEQALKFAVDAAINGRDLDKEPDLFILLADILETKGMHEEAKKHIELTLALRLKNEWRITSDLEERVKKLGINIANMDDVRSMEQDLKSLWKRLKFSNQQIRHGFVSKILPNGMSGFIEEDSGDSHYFRFGSFIGRRDSIREGLRVQFYLEEAFDRKKQRMTMNAVNIEPNRDSK